MGSGKPEKNSVASFHSNLPYLGSTSISFILFGGIPLSDPLIMALRFLTSNHFKFKKANNNPILKKGVYLFIILKLVSISPLSRTFSSVVIL